MGPEERLLINFRVGTQAPLDAKILFITEAELLDLGTNDANAYEYYESMLVKCLETNKYYVWKEVGANESGVITPDFVYPTGFTSNGVTYGDRSFNFVPYYPQEIQPFGALSVRKASGNTDLLNLEAGDYVVHSLMADGKLLLFGRYSGTGDGSDISHYDTGFRDYFDPT